MRAGGGAGPVFCERCGLALKPPLYWCSRCRRAALLTGDQLAKQLKAILEREREA